MNESMQFTNWAVLLCCKLAWSGEVVSLKKIISQLPKDLFQLKGWVVNFAKNKAAGFHIQLMVEFGQSLGLSWMSVEHPRLDLSAIKNPYLMSYT